MPNAMCDDLDAAQRNRERVKQGYGNRFYNEQAHAVAQWALGDKKPESVILGELPYIGRVGRGRLSMEVDTD